MAEQEQPRKLVQITTDIYEDQVIEMERIKGRTTLGRAYQIRVALDKFLKLPKKSKKKK